MSTSLYADALAPFLAEVQRMRPVEAEVIDAHTHLGLDEDGRSLTLEQLLLQLDQAEARRACVFPLHDPERHPAYRLPNDRVLAWAARKRRTARALLPSGPLRRPTRGERKVPRGGGAGDQAAPPRAGFRLRRRGYGRGLRARRKRPRTDPHSRGTRPAAARSRARRSRPASSRGRADPRARSDLRPGNHHDRPGRPSGHPV